MKRIILAFLFTAQCAFGAYTEFWVATTGSNLSAGSPITGGAYPLSYAGGTFVRATGVFTVASGSPSADGVTVGDFASIYTTAGATVATCIGRVTARDTTTVTISTTILSGATANVSETAAAATCVVGGTWKGPNAGVAFPFNFITNALVNSSSNTPRVNFISGTNYAITTGITHSLNGPVTFQGYTTTAGDGGRATIDGGTSTIVLMSSTGIGLDYVDLIFSNNGTTGTNDGFNVGQETRATRITVHDVRGNGIIPNAFGGTLTECEAYLCNGANTSGKAGINLSVSATAIRCVSHDNAGSNTHGFVVSNGAAIYKCIADTNGAKGYNITGVTYQTILDCDAYNNVGDGFDMVTNTAGNFYFENCNAVKNGGWGINSSGGLNTIRSGAIVNCGFGTGTQANTSGTIVTSLNGLAQIGTISYAANVTPWVDPANGDFRISLAAARAAGRGVFTESQASYTGTVGYPDIGAAQSKPVQTSRASAQ